MTCRSQRILNETAILELNFIRKTIMTAFAFIFLVAIRHIWTVHAISITGPTTGYKTDTKSWPSRLEINDLSSSGPAWDLFILALRDMQHADSDAPLSYFQIASIHGWVSHFTRMVSDRCWQMRMFPTRQSISDIALAYQTLGWSERDRDK